MRHFALKIGVGSKISARVHCWGVETAAVVGTACVCVCVVHLAGKTVTSDNTVVGSRFSVDEGGALLATCGHLSISLEHISLVSLLSLRSRAAVRRWVCSHSHTHLPLFCSVFVLDFFVCLEPSPCSYVQSTRLGSALYSSRG